MVLILQRCTFLCRFRKVPRSKCTQSLFASSFSKILLPHQLDIMKEEKCLLQELSTVVRGININAPELDTLKDVISTVDDVFMLVVVGEFNSGKSTLINALLGGEFLKTGPLPTTDKVCILRYMNKVENFLLKDFQEVLLPVEWLEHIAIIDTPGTNAVVSEHEKLAHQVIPRADLILFVTSADRPMSESEASFLKKITAWGRNVIMVVNKMDILQPHEREQTLSFVSQNASLILGTPFPVPVFGVSARSGLQTKLQYKKDSLNSNMTGSNSNGISSMSWDNGTIARLESYLQQLLGKKEIIQKKLLNPLHIMNAIIQTVQQDVIKRLALLDSDDKILMFINNSMNEFMNDIRKDIKYYVQSIKMEFMKLIERYNVFVDETITISNIKYVFDSTELQKKFKIEVLHDLNRPINNLLKECNELILDRAMTQSRAVLAYMGSRPNAHDKHMIGSVRSHNFEESREEYLRELTVRSSEIMTGYNIEDQTLKLESSVNTCMKQFVAVEAFSASSVAGLLAANTLDITGIVAVSSIALSGLFLIPTRRNSMK